MKMPVRRGHRRIEPLQMSHLHNAPMLPSQFKNQISIRKTRCQRLLNQQIDTSSQQRRSSRSVMHCRHTNRCSIQSTNRSQACFNRLKTRNTELLGRRSYRSRITIDHRHQLNRLPRLLKLSQHPQMIAPEGSRPHHRNPQRPRVCHYFFSTGASTASRQRA